MSETIIVDDPRYGDRTHYSSLAEAQASIRECGPEFAAVELTAGGEGLVYDDFGEAIGHVGAISYLVDSRPLDVATGDLLYRAELADRRAATLWMDD